jgi:pyruvate/2-oxoglutarate dehydrogenase complex dihydrolipoamide acyltransferase (E2) component
MRGPTYRTLPWPPIRELVGHRTHAVHGLVEYDVTMALALIERYRALVPGGVSFTAFLAHCLARAVDEHPMLHAHRRRRRRLVIFDDVDVNTSLEQRQPDGAIVAVSYVVRAANHKNLAEINHELLAALRSDLFDDAGVRRRRRPPRWARRVIWWWARRDPARLKREWGTVGLSNLGPFVGARPSWGISLSFLTCTLIAGSIFDRVAWTAEGAQPRKSLAATVSVDHAVVDGGPGARFGETLARLIEGASGLDEAFLEQALALGRCDRARV